MLRFGHAYSRCHRRHTQPHGPRPRYCARKVGLCKCHDSDTKAKFYNNIFFLVDSGVWLTGYVALQDTGTGEELKEQ